MTGSRGVWPVGRNSMLMGPDLLIEKDQERRTAKGGLGTLVMREIFVLREKQAELDPHL